MNRKELISEIKSKGTFLCVGLDPDITKIPKFLLKEEDPIFEFCKQIVDETSPYCVSFKPNTAFYEAYGMTGITSLEKTIKYIKQNYPNHFVIADAKRGDIGNTSKMYAEAFFSKLNADAVTISPYMGSDSVKPFLEFKDKWGIILALTSNEGSKDFQLDGLYKKVLGVSKEWGTTSNMMYVVGATKAEMLSDIRKIIPNHFLLIPGVGAQGGSLSEVCKYGLIKNDIGILVSQSRSIIYASNDVNFALVAGEEARKVSIEMSSLI